VLAALFLAAVLVAAGRWYLTKDIATTDDAYTDGRAITVAPRVSGQVVALEVTDNQHVRAGQLLLRIDSSPFQAALDQAAGALAVAEAQLANSRVALDTARITYPARLETARAQLQAAQAAQFKAAADARRQRALPKMATTPQDLDNAESALRAANAQVAQAQAAVQEAEIVPQSIASAESEVRQRQAQVSLARAQREEAALRLSWTQLTAPQEGWVTRRNVEAGNYIAAGQAVMALVTPQIWVTANFKEDQLDRMKPGQRVEMTVDAFPSLRLIGHVDSIQLGSGSRFSAFPAENATGNFVKIVQRVPVKIVIDEGMDQDHPLPLGLSVIPTVRLQ
jgi:membrane fusion protein, multidrug efflux system